MSNIVQNNTDKPGVIAPPPLIYAVPLLTGLLLHALFPKKLLRFNGVARVLGIILVGGGAGIASTGFREMQRTGTNVNPEQPATTIVTSGPFHYTRNPLYLSMTLLYAGISLLFNSAWPPMLLPLVLTIMNKDVIEREEHYLEHKFGQQYLNYKATVKRWL